jgi:hypothetical protein
MSPPPGGDQSSSEDGTLAQIIPLRRRDPGGETPFGQPSDGSGIFDPPDEPEPLKPRLTLRQKRLDPSPQPI